MSPLPNSRDVPCLSCQAGYGKPHMCDIPDHCPCDEWRSHLRANASQRDDKLERFHQDLFVLAQSWVMDAMNLDISREGFDGIVNLACRGQMLDCADDVYELLKKYAEETDGE